MASTELRSLTEKELFREYPDLEEWFTRGSNMTAQLFDGQRLLSAQEKMDMFGGQDQVRKTLSKDWFFARRSTAILMACRNEPMTSYEIRFFEYWAGLKTNNSASTAVTRDLLDHNLLGITSGLTYVTRSSNLNGFFVAENQFGFLTTNIIWPDRKVIEEKRDQQAEEVAQLVEHRMVQAGKWSSPYNIYAWKMIENLPGKFSPARKMARAVLQPLSDWEAEAFRIDLDTPHATTLSLSMRSRGRAPIKTPLWGSPTLKLDEVATPLLGPYIEDFPQKFRYRKFLKLSLPVIFSSKVEGLDLGQVPGYDQIIIKPFWLYAGEKGYEWVVAEDPFRLVFEISGAPLGYMEGEIQKLRESLGGEGNGRKMIYLIE